jgi:alcohol dehydrogenase class IV
MHGELNFEFATATRVLFAPGSLNKIGLLASDLGQRALVVMGSNLERGKGLLELLSSAKVRTTCFQVQGEPTVGLVQEGVNLARQQECDLVICFGGGSVMDTGKAIAALLSNPGEVEDYLEVIGRGQALSSPSLPCIAIPTTAGTGAEVTRNAVLGVPSHQVKVSLRSPLMLPRLALVDPELTYNLPPEITASSGLDALTQLIEPYVSNKANPLTDALCREGIQRIAVSLLRAYLEPTDVDARQQMSLASLFGGLALANAGLGVVHGFAGVLGGMFLAPHGAICARLLPFVMEVNVRALQQRQPESPALRRYREIASWLTGIAGATVSQGIAWIQEICLAMCVSPLTDYGLSAEHFSQVVEKTVRASSTRSNPIELTSDELIDILSQAI